MLLACSGAAETVASHKSPREKLKDGIHQDIDNLIPE